MTHIVVSASVVVLFCFSCGKDKSKNTELRRERDQASVVIVGASEGGGSQIKESEPNNEPAQAQALAMGSAASGSLDGSLDLDRYLVSAEIEGLLFAKLDGAADADLKLELHDSEGKLLARSDRGPAGTVEGVRGYWLDAPARYQLVVSEFTKRKHRKTGGRQGASAPYRLQVTHRPSPEQGFELEANDDLEGAMEVGAGEERYGHIGWAGDSDWWRMPVAGFADVLVGAPEVAETARRPALNIVISGMERVSTRLELVDAAGELVASRISAPGQEVAIRSFVPDLSAEFYVVKVQAKRSNPEENYTIGVELTELANGQEEEPNDELEQATPLGSDLGDLILASGEVCLGDVDMFSLSPASMNRAMDLRLDGPSDADLNVSVVAESGAILAQSEQAGVGISETLQAVNVPPNSSPVIIVRAKKVVMPAAYKLSLSVTEGQGAAQASALPSPANPDLQE